MHFRVKSQHKSLFLNISVQRTHQFLLLLERNIYSPLSSLHKECPEQDSPPLLLACPPQHLTQHQVMMLVLSGTCPTAKGVMLGPLLLCNHTWLVVAAWRYWGCQEPRASTLNPTGIIHKPFPPTSQEPHYPAGFISNKVTFYL